MRIAKSVLLVSAVLMAIIISSPVLKSNTYAATAIVNDCNSSGQLNASNCGIIRYLILFINVLSALVGIVIITMIVWAGIEYSASSDDPQKTAAAKAKITNALLALLVFVFMYAFLQWIVPGGIF